MFCTTCTFHATSLDDMTEHEHTVWASDAFTSHR